MKRYILLFLFLFQTLEKSDVYFTKEISREKIVEMFKKLNVKLEGNIGLKVHTGEKDGPYFLRPSFLKNIYDYTNGTFIECNTAYTSGSRLITESDYNNIFPTSMSVSVHVRVKFRLLLFFAFFKI